MDALRELVIRGAEGHRDLGMRALADARFVGTRTVDTFSVDTSSTHVHARIRKMD